MIFRILIGLTCTGLIGASVAQAQNSSTTKFARVFVLAGQSNMQGHGVVDLTGTKDYNRGQGSLLKLLKQAKFKNKFAHLVDEDGSWSSRKDVWVRYQLENELKQGPLSVGYTAYENERRHFGPELQFGHVVGDAFHEPVILIKTAWGGKSLHVDFRPPSSGGKVGPYFEKMMEEIESTLANFAERFPQFKDRTPVLSGFVWQQGWNDMVDKEATDEYEANLINLVKDVRKRLNKPDLPFVYGELGNGGQAKTMENDQLSDGSRISCHSDVFEYGFFVSNEQVFARPAKSSPNVDHLHHWFGNAESYYLIGKRVWVKQCYLWLNRIYRTCS